MRREEKANAPREMECFDFKHNSFEVFRFYFLQSFAFLNA